MSNDSLPSTASSETFADETGLTAVLAHSMLGTVSAVRGAIDLARSDEPSTMSRDSLLSLAMNRLEFLTTQLRDLAAGIPGTVVPAIDPTQRHGDPVLEDGTRVELHNRFNKTWSAGFEIASVAELGYRVRRSSDGSLLPGYTSRSDLRTLEDRVESRP